MSLSAVCRTVVTVVAGLILSANAHSQITRVANTTLTLPQNPQTFGYGTEDAFAGLTFDQPLGIVTPPGETDRVFVVEKTGRIQVVTNLSSTPVKQVFLDLSARVLTSSEQGALGLAFHPDFANNHYFYVFYSTTATTSVGTGAHQRVARFTALTGSPTNAQILATEVPLISQRDEADNHNGGDLHFGPDGYLYVSLGDEGGGNDQFNNSQRIDKDFFSGLLRIDVDQRAGNLAPNAHPSVHAGTYKIPADNPFVGAAVFNGAAVIPANVRTEFWAVGLRNPWRFSFDSPTGRLLLGDVGQGAREEIDLITRGGNYGWNYREGTIAGPKSNPPAGASFIEPIWDADRSTASSITGGVVYRGSRFAQLFGRYVFGDYGAGRLFFMSFPASGLVQVENSISVSGPAGFGTDPRNGDILIASISTGRLLRLVYNATTTGTPLPATLTATGAFTNVATLTPAAGMVAYDPNVSFWSDYAKKRRWFSVPALADKITFSSEGNWTFPAGTVWVKHFDLELTRGDPTTARRLETRFLVKTSGGVYGVTYKWNTAQTEATLVAEAGETESITINDGGTIRSQTWRYPSRSECLQCHTPVAGHALSFNTAQLNRPVDYNGVSANQLEALAAAGYFNAASVPTPASLPALAPAGDVNASLERRVRSYLAANCVQCHQPGGAALGNWDARFSTPTASAGLLNGLLIDSRGDSSNRVLAPADPAHSVMLSRISTRGLGQMPPLASSELDTVNIALLTSWINALNANGTLRTIPHDFNGDGKSDVFWTNTVTGDRAMWQMNGGTISTNTFLGTVPVAWAVSGTGDFSGDSRSDVLWTNTLTGDRAMWLLNGSTVSAGAYLGAVPVAWVVSGTGDFNGDGQADIFWTNTGTGERAIWLMNGGAASGGTSLGVVPLAWAVSGTGDFNGDGKADILLSNTATGDRVMWLMNGTTVATNAFVGTVPVDWLVSGSGDFDGNGKADIFWTNTSTGDRAVWLMNGSALSAGGYLGAVPVAWVVTNTGDYNGDGKTDVLWSNTSTGERAMWLMNGLTTSGGASLGVVPVVWVPNN